MLKTVLTATMSCSDFPFSTESWVTACVIMNTGLSAAGTLTCR